MKITAGDIVTAKDKNGNNREYVVLRIDEKRKCFQGATIYKNMITNKISKKEIRLPNGSYIRCIDSKNTIELENVNSITFRYGTKWANKMLSRLAHHKSNNPKNDDQGYRSLLHETFSKKTRSAPASSLTIVSGGMVRPK